MKKPEDEFLSKVVALMPRLRNFAIGLCRDAVEADDLVQDKAISEADLGWEGAMETRFSADETAPPAASAAGGA